MKSRIIIGILIALLGVLVFVVNFFYVDRVFLLILGVIVFFVGFGLALNPDSKEGFVAEVLNVFSFGGP
ncbi:MAG: hypothetical protein ABIJ58_01460 [Nanoarchaeota archaeon]